MNQHVVVIGYGTKGRSAVETLRQQRHRARLDRRRRPQPVAQGEAHDDGLAVVTGDATRREVLRRAGVEPGGAGDHHHRTETTPRCSRR